MTVWRIRIASWIPKVTDTHSEYVKLIAFPLQQWLRERASLLRYSYSACIFKVLPPITTSLRYQFLHHS